MNIVGRKPCLTPEQQAKLHEWASLGTNQRQVALAMGIHPRTVSNYLAGKLKRPVRSNGE
jgi:DNA-binding CsgD family transcriptional regulator